MYLSLSRGQEVASTGSPALLPVQHLLLQSGQGNPTWWWSWAPDNQLSWYCILTPAQDSLTLAKLFHSHLVNPWLGWFSRLEIHMYPHIHIYNFFVFTFKYKNTTLLCVINGGPRNQNLFFLYSRANPSGDNTELSSRRAWTPPGKGNVILGDNLQCSFP